MTLSIGAATDYLYATAQTTSSGITVNGHSVLVVDGWPHELAFGMFVIGLSAPPPDVAGDTIGTRMWEGLGARHLQEDYTIPCYIDVRVPGTTQKTARDLAESIFNPFWSAITADLTLGGALKGGRYAEITDLASTPSNVGEVGDPGRRQFIQFGVHCRSLTT